MKMLRHLSLGIATLSFATTAGADLPELILPQGMGVNIHFTRGHERDLDMIAAGGFKLIRMDFGWAGIERRKREYDWSAYDELTANLEKRGLRAIYILDYSNPLYEEAVLSKNPLTGNEQRDIASPQHPESVDAFARWAGAAAKHFAGRRIIWEIWNEPNISFWKPKPDAAQYTALALATAKAVRAADPNATIIGPATSEVPITFLEEFFAAGALDHLDAVSVHPYRSYAKGPETAHADYKKLRALIEKHAPPGKKNMPIISGEWGYSTFTNKGVSLETQAAFLARQQLANLCAGVPISIWYDWKNDGPDPKEREHNFGTVTHDLQPKPSYDAAQTLARELSGYRIEKRLAATSTDDWVLLCSRGPERKLAAWTTGAPHSATVPGINDGVLSLNLSPTPQYISVKPAAGSEVVIPPSEKILSTLRPEHPRLLGAKDDFVRLSQRIDTDAQLKKWHAVLRAEGAKLLTQPTSKYEIPDGLRLLHVSRRVLHRIQVLGLLYQLDRDDHWRDRAWRELEAAANFPDWNPRHFLDTAEMTHAFAIGYDWIYGGWTPEQRGTLRTAMIEKGIKLAIKIHQEKRWWAVARHNWNQVCNGGIGIGALAIADEEPKLAAEFLEAALRSIQLPMREFAPDGAWAEGPGYWDYATTYNVAFVAALDSALGNDFGLSAMPGFSEAGMFPLYLTGPLNRTFNYADGGDGAIRAPHLFWMARRFGKPAYAAYQSRLASPEPLDLLWFQPSEAAVESLPLDKHFRGADVVTLRSGWDDPNALFIGFKAGDNKANHSHLDLGSFVFDALGKRWAIDLGADDYNLPGYFGKARWTYYRLRAEGQNALVLNSGEGPDQELTARGKMERFESTRAKAFAIADLSPAYAKHAESVRRGVALIDRQGMLIQDEVASSSASDAWWFLHTPAEIRIATDGRSATLKQGEATLRARLLSPADAKFEIREAAPLPTSPQPERQNPNKGIRKLSIHVAVAANFRVSVWIAPDSVTNIPAVQPLANW